MRRASTACAVLIALVASSLAGAVRADSPRLASATICADQYLLALAPRDQIASLSWQSEHEFSFYADRARGIPKNRARAEELLKAGADLVLMDSSDGTHTPRLLRAHGIEIVEIPYANSFSEVEAAVRHVAAAIGRVAEGEALIADMNARLAHAASLVGDVAEARRPVLAYFNAGGAGAGSGTYVHETLRRAGFRNLQALQGQAGWAFLPMERLVMSPPDAIAISFFSDNFASVRETFARHPLFWKTARGRPLIEIPGKLWVCPSHLLARVTELLADANAQHFGPGAHLAHDERRR